jgi:hypothetical protein
MNSEEKVIAAALAQANRLSQSYGSPQTINLTIYLTDDDLRQLRPEDGLEATCEQQQRITQAVAAALRDAGHRVDLIPLRVVDYMRWLTAKNLSNTAANRAQWATWQINQSPAS